MSNNWNEGDRFKAADGSEWWIAVTGEVGYIRISTSKERQLNSCGWRIPLVVFNAMNPVKIEEPRVLRVLEILKEEFVGTWWKDDLGSWEVFKLGNVYSLKLSDGSAMRLTNKTIDMMMTEVKE